MLVQFRVQNYKSFMDDVTFSMECASLTPANKKLNETNIFSHGNFSLVKSALLYGANASGKSNFVQALAFMAAFIRDSAKDTQVGEAIPIEKFLLSTTLEAEPSAFEIVFLIADTLYRYGFMLDRKKIQAEWLYYRPNKREICLFSRQEQEISLSKNLVGGKGLERRARDNALFLSVCAAFNVTIAVQIVAWFNQLGIVSDVEMVTTKAYVTQLLQDNPELSHDVSQLMQYMDLSIAALSLPWAEKQRYGDGKLPTVTKKNAAVSQSSLATEPKGIKTLHQKYDEAQQIVEHVLFDMESHESAGTQKLFVLATMILLTLKERHVLIIDELDARLHPLMSKALLRLFNSSQANPRNAQLIFTSHDSSLLDKDIFRRDQIWFIEKDAIGASQLYSLAEYKVRNDASFAKDYMHSKYGATPYLEPIHELVASFHV